MSSEYQFDEPLSVTTHKGMHGMGILTSGLGLSVITQPIPAGIANTIVKAVADLAKAREALKHLADPYMWPEGPGGLIWQDPESVRDLARRTLRDMGEEKEN